LAGWGLQKAGVHQAIQSTDETLDSYNPNTIYQEKKEAAQETAGNLLQSVKDRFWSSESDPESESDSSPENQETSELNDQATKKLEPGFLEKNLYPQLVSFFTGIIRLIAVLLGLIGLGLATYLGYITQSLRQTQQLSRRCSKLEKEMAELKKKAALEN
jgi:hypothetical protein